MFISVLNKEGTAVHKADKNPCHHGTELWREADNKSIGKLCLSDGVSTMGRNKAGEYIGKVVILIRMVEEGLNRKCDF